jgi:hypothetical protein
MSRGDLYRPQRNWGVRIREYLYKGMQAVFLENEQLRIGVLAGKGTDMFELNYKPQDLDFVWLSARGVQNPTSYLSTSPDSLATFLDSYLGGWQEIVPNGGAPSSYLGAQFGQHGEACLLPWDYQIVEDTPEQVAVTFSVRLQKIPFFLEKTLRLQSQERSFSVEETLHNESTVPLHAMWGQHITFGQPFLDEHCIIRLPEGIRVVPHPTALQARGRRRVKGSAESVWPNALGADGDLIDLSQLPARGTSGELVYLAGFQEGWYEVLNPTKGLGLRVEWDVTQMPYLWFWQEYGDTTEYPWYGRHYNIGLEPFSSYPTNGLAEAVANGTALSLNAREPRHFSYRAAVIEA